MTTGAAFEATGREREAALSAAEARLRRREAALSIDRAEMDARREQLAGPRQRAEAREGEARQLREQARATELEVPRVLERCAGQTAAALRAGIMEAELEDARLAAAQLVRMADQAGLDDAGRRAKRVMGIAVGRFSGHYLTERLLSMLPLPQG